MIANVTQEIMLLIRAKDEASKSFQSITKNTKELQKTFAGIKTSVEKDQIRTFDRLSNSMDLTRMGSMGLRDSFRLSLAQMKDMKKLGLDQQLPALAKVGFRFRELTHGMRGFRMELLSVMFFGMGLQRMFGGLLQPALEASGIFEIWSTILEVLFLPVALLLLPIMLGLMDIIMNMPPDLQLVIGAFVGLAAILGAVMFFVGQLGLGLGGLTMALSGGTGLAATATKADDAVDGMQTTLTGANAAMTGVNAKTSLFNKSVSSLKNILGKVGNFLIFIVKAFGALIAVVFMGIAVFEGIKSAVSIFDKALQDAGIETSGFKANIGRLPMFFGDVAAAVVALGRTVGVVFIGGFAAVIVKGIQFANLLNKVLVAPLNFFIDRWNDLAGAMNLPKLANIRTPGGGIGTALKSFLDMSLFGELGRQISGIKKDYLDTKQAIYGYNDALGKQKDETEDSEDALEEHKKETTKAADETKKFTVDINGASYAAEDFGYMLDETGGIMIDTGKLVKTASEAFTVSFSDTADSASYLSLGFVDAGDSAIQFSNQVISAKNRWASAFGGGGSSLVAREFTGWITSEARRAIEGPASYNIRTGEWTALQHGGIVTRPTRALIGEAGPEAVIPLSEGGAPVSVNPTYNINASVSSDMDIRKLASRLNDLLVSDYRRLSFR